MDVAALSIGLNHGQLKQGVSIALMKKTMESSNQNAASLIQMLQTTNVQAIQRAAQPHLGGAIDMRV